MIYEKIKTLLRPLRGILSKKPDIFLKQVSGVVHVGGNLGQERELYASHGLSVVWIEPIPEVFTQLKSNIRVFVKQQAFQALITDVDGKEYKFNLANNGGQSSSILAFKQHTDICPDVRYTSAMLLKSITLATLFKNEKIDSDKYQALIMDTQGSELLVLRGALPLLEHFQFIKVEVSNFESYEECCQLSDISHFMNEHGYREFSRYKFASREQGGEYFDIVYKRHT